MERNPQYIEVWEGNINYFQEDIGGSMQCLLDQSEPNGERPGKFLNISIVMERLECRICIQCFVRQRGGIVRNMHLFSLP